MLKHDLLGTGFIVTMPSDFDDSNLGKQFLYIVTAKHVIDGLQGADCGVRINNADGTSSMLTAPKRWWFHPTDETVDFAVMPFGPPKDVPFNFAAFPDGSLCHSGSHTKSVNRRWR